MLYYLKGTLNLITTLSVKDAVSGGLSFKWYIDAAFIVHADYKSHIGNAFKNEKKNNLQYFHKES